MRVRMVGLERIWHLAASISAAACSGNVEVHANGGGSVYAADGGGMNAAGSGDAGAHDALEPLDLPDVGIDVATACLGDANVLIVAGDDGYMHTGPPTIVPVIGLDGIGGAFRSSVGIKRNDDAGWYIGFDGDATKAPLAVGKYVCSSPDGPTIGMSNYAKGAGESLAGSEFEIVEMTYQETDPIAPWTMESFTAIYVMYSSGTGPLSGCVHFQL